MENERKELLKKAEKMHAPVNKFMNTAKIRELVEKEERLWKPRSNVLKRAWESRKALFGPTGFKAGHGPRVQRVITA